ncbi:hypothetical protein N9N40_08890 [Planktomarina temperata]|nr:hypothetical protein [Planktomarina temperata]MDB4854190.1 hypothetical protein [Planktomarina temperata]
MKRGEIQFELQAPKVAFLSARKTLVRDEIPNIIAAQHWAFLSQLTEQYSPDGPIHAK